MKKLLLFIIVTSISANDLPNFWRAPLFQGEPKKDFTTCIDVKGSYGSTRKGFDAHGHSTNILNIYGLININTLATNLENLTIAAKPTTYNYLKPTTGTIPALNFTGDNGKIELNGKLNTQELASEVTMNFMYGFYGKAHIPYRWAKIYNISLINKTSSTATGAATFQSFLDNNFNTVLEENNLAPVNKNFNRQGIGDIELNLGWQRFSDNFDIIKNLLLNISASLTIPTGPKEMLNQVVSIPIGYNGHFGLGAKFNALAHFSNWLGIGANIGTNIFLDKTTTMRMKTSKTQNGLITLEKGRATIHKGTLWNLGGYIKASPIGKIFLIAGYSYTTEESTQLSVKDDIFLSTLLFNEAQTGSITSNKNDIVNSDQKLKSWNQHVLQFTMGYNAHGKFAPHIEIFYNCPIIGERIFRTKMIGGQAGLTLHFDF